MLAANPPSGSPTPAKGKLRNQQVEFKFLLLEKELVTSGNLFDLSELALSSESTDEKIHLLC